MSSPWSQPDFRRLWAGRTIAAAGYHVTVLTMQLTASVTLGTSAFEMGLLVAAQSSPGDVGSQALRKHQGRPLRRTTSAYQRAESFGIRPWVA